jgi:hypothetical protein
VGEVGSESTVSDHEKQASLPDFTITLSSEWRHCTMSHDAQGGVLWKMKNWIFPEIDARILASRALSSILTGFPYQKRVIDLAATLSDSAGNLRGFAIARIWQKTPK